MSAEVVADQKLAAVSKSDTRLQRIYGATALSALLSFASHYPLDLGPLAFVAIVPVLLIAATEGRRVGLAVAFSFTVLYHLVGLTWISMTTPEGWLLTSFLQGFYGATSICFPLWIRRRTGLPLVLGLPIVGAALEYIRANCWFVGFPWLFWGHTQHSWSTLIQIADVTSVYGLTFLVLAVNGAIAEVALLYKRRFDTQQDPKPADRRRQRDVALVAAVLILLALIYGFARSAHVESAMEANPGPRLLIVQVDIPQDLKDGGWQAWKVADANLRKTDLALKRNKEPVDAIIWSETMWPYPVPDERSAAERNGWEEYVSALENREGDSLSAKRARTYGENIRALAPLLMALPKRIDGPLLVGSMDHGFGGREPHNSVYCIAADENGKGTVTDRYDKVELVPVSEYIPFKNTPGMGWFFDMFKSFVPPGFVVFEAGGGPVLMQAGEYKLAPNICFEISFPELLRKSTLMGADVHVCPANDGWFIRGGQGDATRTAEVDLARAHTKFRAIENRRAMVRCVNRGVSLVLDPLGRQVGQIKKLGANGEMVEVGVDDYLFSRAPTTKLRSFYVRFGSVFPLLCLLSGLLLGLLAWKERRLLEPPDLV